MLLNERHNAILRRLEENGSVTVSELIERFGISAETVRRDLFHLEGKNLLQRVHGGAIAPSRMCEYQTLEKRLEENTDKKSEAAHTAMGLLRENEVIFVDCGSTAVEFARVLKAQFEKMTVITHSLDVWAELRNKRGFKLIIIGGEYTPDEAANNGFAAVEMANSLHASKAFIFPVAVSLKNGVSDQSMEFVAMQHAFMENADRTVFVADSTKFEKNAFVRICDMNQENVFATDADLSDDLYKAYREKNIKIFRSKEELKGEALD